MVFVTQTVWWLNGQTMFDQTSDKVSPHNAFCVLPLKKYVYVTQLFSRSRKPFWQRCLIEIKLGKPFKCNVERGGLNGKTCSSNTIIDENV